MQICERKLLPAAAAPSLHSSAIPFWAASGLLGHLENKRVGERRSQLWLELVVLTEEEEGAGRKKTLVGGTTCPPCSLSEVGQIVDMPGTKSLLDLGPKSTLFMHAGVEKNSEYQGLPLPPTRLPLLCAKARVGLGPEDSPTSSIPVELCVWDPTG